MVYDDNTGTLDSKSRTGPDAIYVSKLLEDLRNELQGFHKRIVETEEVRYLEDRIGLGEDEAKSGVEIRIGALAELVENVKSAICSAPPRVIIEPVRSREGADTNAAKRERFLTRMLERINQEVPVITRFADSLIALGMGTLKVAKVDYPPSIRVRRDGESESDHLSRVKAEKALFGPPFEVIDVHPLSEYFRLGQGSRVSEVVEHSWKARVDMYRNYGLLNDKDLKRQSIDGNQLRPKVAGYVRTVRGTPDTYERSFPLGLSSSTLCLVTEYWSPDWYQVYLDRRLIYEESKPTVAYFMALGRTNSSTDMDKIGFGVGEILRHNEPAINRMLTRMAEANELLVRQRLTMEVPEGDTNATVMDMEQGTERPRTIKFRADAAEALPAGWKVVNPYEGVQHVYDSMPLVSMLQGVLAQHGVSPLFKGMPPGAVGSGYRDNSLYEMAKTQLQTTIDAYQGALSRLCRWVEGQIAEGDETVYIDELELKPSDITNWPARLTVAITPTIPQSMIAEGSFYDRMHAARHITRRVVREKGLNLEDPAAMEEEVLEEDLKEALKPQLVLDVLSMVTGLRPPPTDGIQPQAQNGNPDMRGPGGAQSVIANRNVGPGGMADGGYSRGGQPRQPEIQPGSTVPS